MKKICAADARVFASRGRLASSAGIRSMAREVARSSTRRSSARESSRGARATPRGLERGAPMRITGSVGAMSASIPTAAASTPRMSPLARPSAPQSALESALDGVDREPRPSSVPDAKGVLVPRRRRKPRAPLTDLDALWSSWRARPCDELRNLLVEAYQSLVRDVVRRVASRLPRSVDRGDLETAANFGLIGAIEGFDRERGVRFESYCELRIKGALLDELRTQDWLPRPWRHRLERHKRELERLRAEKQAEPSDEEMAAALAMPLDEYAVLFGTGLPGSSPSAGGRGGGEAGGVSVLDIVADTHADAPEDKLTRDELLRLIAQRLTEQEYRVVYLRYWEELSMREIGELENLSESRVYKIHARLIERLRERFHAASD
jgi:RNA polymerase sigma factor for flagellar operon FliA